MKKDITPAYKFDNGTSYPAVELVTLGAGRIQVLCGGKEDTAIRNNSGWTLTMDDGTFVCRNTTKQGLRNFTPAYYNRNDR